MNLGAYLSSMGRGGDSLVAHINPREAALLKALGGRGSINPRTGLLEFDGAGGGSDQQYIAPATPMPITTPSNTGPSDFQPSSTGYSGGVTLGNPYQSALASSYGEQALPNAPALPSNAAPIQPQLFNQISQQFDNMGSDLGGTPSTPFLRQLPEFIATPDNPNFVIGPDGYATFSPQGQQAYNAYVEQQQAATNKNAAGNAGGIGGFLGTPLGGLSVLGFPLAIGGAVAGLGGAGIADFTAGGGGAVGGDFGLGAGGYGVSPGLISANTVPDATAGFGAGDAAGAAGGAAGTLADAGGVAPAATGITDPTAILDQLGLGPNTIPFAPSADTIGLGGDTASSFGFNSPAFLGSSVADPAAASAPLDLSTAGGVSSPATAGAVGGDLGLGGGSDIPSGLIADAVTGGSTTTGTGGGLFGNIGNWLESNPLKALGMVASAGGLLTSFGKQSSSGLDQNALISTLENQAKNLSAGLDPAATAAITQQAKSLASGVNPAATQAISNEAAALGAQGNTLAGYLASGTLPPGAQNSINQAAQQAKAAIRSKYAQMGMSGSSAEMQDLANVDQTAATQGVQIATQLLQQGVSETQLSGQLYSTLVSQSQAGAQSAAQLYQALLNNSVQQTGLSDQLYSQLLGLATQQNAALGQAIGNFASSLASTTKPLTVQVA